MEKEAGVVSAVRTWDGDGWQARTLGIIHAGDAEVVDCLARLVGRLSAHQSISEKDVLPGHVSVIIDIKNSGVAYLISDWLGVEFIYYKLKNDKIIGYSFSIKELIKEKEDSEICANAMDEFFSYRWLNNNNTIFNTIKTIPAGYITVIRKDSTYNMHKYITPQYHGNKNLNNAGDIEYYTNELDIRIEEYFSKIKKRYTKIGVLASGGVDSSLLLSKLMEHQKFQVTALSASFFDSTDNLELELAKEVSGILHITHDVSIISDNYIATNYPIITGFLESPLTYLNAFARLHLMERAKAAGVELILSGEGADGMFGADVGGAAHVLRLQRLRDAFAYAPSWMRNAIAWAGGRFGGRLGALAHQATVAGIPRVVREQGQLFRLGATTNSRDCAERMIPALRRLREVRQEPFYTTIIPENQDLGVFRQNVGLYTQNRHQYHTYTKLAHRVGIAFDCPFLSGPISELGFRVPTALRSDERGSKPILRRMLLRYVPERIVYAPKRGWETGGTRWLWGPLRKWQDILTDEVAERRGIYDVAAIRSADWKGNEHVLWSLMSFEMFLRVFMDGSGRPPASLSLPAA